MNFEFPFKEVPAVMRSPRVERRRAPTCLTKSPTSLHGHRGQILKPADCQYLNYEGEYAVAAPAATSRPTRPGTASKASAPRSTWACRTSARPTRVRCCV